jgi:tetratricopeptide (TPR) repeat protein
MSRAGRALPKGVPDCLKKRRLLNEKELSPDLCREYGEKFLALGWLEDALEFFQKGRHLDGLESIKTLALERGDAYLLARLGRQEPETWRRLAERAMTLGKFQSARRALELAGDKDRAAALAQGLAGLEGENPASGSSLS